MISIQIVKVMLLSIFMETICLNDCHSICQSQTPLSVDWRILLSIQIKLAPNLGFWFQALPPGTSFSFFSSSSISFTSSSSSRMGPCVSLVAALRRATSAALAQFTVLPHKKIALLFKLIWFEKYWKNLRTRFGTVQWWVTFGCLVWSQWDQSELSSTYIFTQWTARLRAPF